MKITEIRIGKISVPLRTPFKTALRTVASVEDVVFEIHTDTGAVGYGEAPPTGVITGDTTGAIIGAVSTARSNQSGCSISANAPIAPPIECAYRQTGASPMRGRTTAFMNSPRSRT